MEKLNKYEYKYFKETLEKEFPILIERKSDIYSVYSLDGKLIFITRNPHNILKGLKSLYGGISNG